MCQSPKAEIKKTIRSHTLPFRFKTVLEMCLLKTDRTLSSPPAHDPVRGKLLCGWIARELEGAKPDVFKVLKTYDQPADFFNLSAQLLLRILWQFLCGGGGEGWNTVSSSVGKIRIGFSFLVPCSFPFSRFIWPWTVSCNNSRYFLEFLSCSWSLPWFSFDSKQWSNRSHAWEFHSQLDQEWEPKVS